MRTKKIVGLGVSLFMLGGCAAPPLWYKPGASTQDFNVDKYQCMQGSQQQTSSVYIGPYGGSGSSGQSTNSPLYNACMNAKGWTLQAQSADTVQSNAEAQSASKALAAKADSMCADPKFEPYYSKTACTTEKITFDQLIDKSKISPAARAIFPELRRAVDAITEEDFAVRRKYGGSVQNNRANLYYSTFKSQNDKNNANLYDGSITWGEYNKRRQELRSEYIAAASKITS